MSTSLLYHGFGVRGYIHVRTAFVDGQIHFHIEQPDGRLCCSGCKSRKVIRRGARQRRFRGLPIGGKAVWIVLAVPRLECKTCGAVVQAEVAFAPGQHGYTKRFARYVLELARHMSMLDVTRHLGGIPAAGRSAENPDVRRYNSLIASTQLQIADAIASHVMSVDARIAALDTLRIRNSADIRALPQKEAEEMRLMQQVETTGRVADQLREEYQRARIAEAVEIGQVEIVDLATLPYEPIGAGPPLKIALGIMLGLMLGSGAAFLREHMNTSIRRSDEIEPLLNVPGLAVVPRLAGLNGKSTPRLRLPGRAEPHRGNGKAVVSRPLENLVTVSDMRSSGAEAYRSLRTNLMFSHGADSLKRIVVTSPFAAEGKTTTSSNLAVTYAQQGLRVLLIDGDLRKAALHRTFGLPREPGFCELMLGMEEPKKVVHSTGVDGLFVLTSGTLPPNPSELLGAARTRKLLDQLATDYDIDEARGPLAQRAPGSCLPESSAEWPLSRDRHELGSGDQPCAGARRDCRVRSPASPPPDVRRVGCAAGAPLPLGGADLSARLGPAGPRAWRCRQRDRFRGRSGACVVSVRRNHGPLPATGEWGATGG